MAPYRQYIATAYKSLEHPDFSFVKKGFSSRPYDPVIKRLRDWAVVEEAAEADDDVCFSFFLKGQAALWKLDLSLVGPFAIFVRLRNRISESDFLHLASSDATSFELKVLDVMQGAGIRLMTAEELKQQVPLTLFNTDREDVRLYHALFSDRGRLPWDS